MTTHFGSIQEILDFAVKREEEAAAGYARMRTMARTEPQKELLSDLENEEKKHKQLLLGLSGLKAEALNIKPVSDLRISDYTVAEPPGTDMSFQDLLLLAAKKEQKAVELYSQLLARATTPDQRKLFEFLMMQEKTHKLMLETEYDKHVLSED